jgi:hypothetical protein
MVYRHLENYQGKQPVSELTALVALIRRASGIDSKLTAFDDTVRKNFQNWIMAQHSGPNPKFNDAQVKWLQMIRDHITTSFHLERDDLEMAPFDRDPHVPGSMFDVGCSPWPSAIAGELVHFTEAAFAVEGGHVQIVAFDVERGGDVVGSAQSGTAENR